MYNAGRSPFAEYAMKRALEERGIGDVEVYSAGLSEKTKDGMPAPPPVVEASQHLGVDVTSHRRKRLTDEMTRSADDIYVFERAHATEIESRYPPTNGKVRVLREIQDLKGTPVETHIKHLREIKEAVEGLVERFIE